MSVAEHIRVNGEVRDIKDSISGYITSSSLSPYRTSEAQDVIDNTKVDKVSGKGLSTNDYDSSEKQKVADAYSDKHTHSNKALLDTYTQTEANLSDAVTKKHEHSNKSVIDTISSALVNTWNTASTWITNNGANVLSHLADSVVHITSAERTAWNAKYTKPSDGIPKTDLASGVQTSLGLADTALQSHQSLSAYRTSAAQDVIDATKQDQHTTATATLATASWSNKAQTVSVSGVTASNTVIVSPAPSSVENWATAKIYCSAQGNGTLTFTCLGDAPSSDVTANIAVLD